MAFLSCPLCAALLPPAALEPHLLRELGYTSLLCLLCPTEFFARADAEAHFRGRGAAHPREAVRIGERRDWALERRLAELSRAAGAPACVCGCCHGCSDASVQGQGLASPLDQDVEEPERTEKSASELPDTETGESANQEASEAEEAPSEEPEQKPQLSSDGKVACLLCEQRLDKANFKNHGLRQHMTVHPFLCSLCPVTAKRKDTMQKHHKASHQVESSPETMTVISVAGEVEKVVEECFGSAKDLSGARVHCRECKSSVLANQKRQHASGMHLKKPIHACRLCPYTTCYLSASVMAKHMKARHSQALTPANWVSEEDKYGPIVERMLPQLFVE